MASTRRAGITRRGVLAGAAAGLAAVRFGAAPAIAQAPVLRIGALLPLSGGLDRHAAQMRLGIDTALASVNGGGGVLGRPVEAVYRDAQGTPQGLDAVCRALVEDDGVAAVVGPFIAAGRKAAARSLGALGVPLVSATNNEGEFCRANYFSLGTDPNQDVVPLIRHLDGGVGRSYFLVGSATSWQVRAFQKAALEIIYGVGGSVLGEALTTIGERRFAPVIRWIAETGAEAVIFCVPRPEGAAFVRQAKAMGLLDSVRLGWAGFNELHAERVSPAAAAHVVTVSPFVSADPQGGVPDLVARMRAAAQGAMPITYYAFTHHNAVAAVAAAARRSGEASPAAITAGLAGLRFDSATGPVAIDAASHHATLNLVAARGGGDGLTVVERLGAVAAGPGCAAA